MSMLQQRRAEEVDLLRLTAINNGDALAQYVQGRFTIPRGFLLDYIKPPHPFFEIVLLDRRQLTRGKIFQPRH